MRTSSDFVVLASRTRAELRLHRATSDISVVFRGMHPDSTHWSNHLRMPTGLRVALRHVGLGVEVAAVRVRIRVRARGRVRARARIRIRVRLGSAPTLT